MEKIITDIPEDKLNYLIFLLKKNDYISDFDFKTTTTRYNTCLRLKDNNIMGVGELEIYKDWWGTLVFTKYPEFIRSLKIKNIL